MIQYSIPDGKLSYDAGFYNKKEADKLYEMLMSELALRQNDIVIFGKEYKTPRLEGFYSKNGERYGYSGRRMESIPFSPVLKTICNKIESKTSQKFNSVLINLYRDGQDSNGWHSDDENELGNNPFIASLSFGEARKIQFKHKSKGYKMEEILTHGSLMLMSGSLQTFWKHQIPKTKKKKEARLNLTFRNIIG
ncbi:MAG: alpha-ketoglutarate-dependent dioxygenase AlkB [Crocinitomicaceae bacterium]|nr:alpha-ketoglutarate-dependent dioxygenase AlkB [Crocinitomicaceae bacterium]